MRKFLMIMALAVLTACATSTDPMQQFINEATQATKLVDQVVLASDAAVKAGVLKGQDAANTLAAVTAASKGIRDARSLSMVNPAQALMALRIQTATMVTTQTYLTSLQGAKP